MLVYILGLFISIINVNTDEPVGSTFFVETRITQNKVCCQFFFWKSIICMVTYGPKNRFMVEFFLEIQQGKQKIRQIFESGKKSLSLENYWRPPFIEE